MKIEWYAGSSCEERPKAFHWQGKRLLVLKWIPLALRRDEKNREYKEFYMEVEDGSSYRVTLYPDGSTLVMSMPKREI